jgi:hypothetical protein
MKDKKPSIPPRIQFYIILLVLSPVIPAIFSIFIAGFFDQIRFTSEIVYGLSFSTIIVVIGYILSILIKMFMKKSPKPELAWLYGYGIAATLVCIYEVFQLITYFNKSA